MEQISIALLRPGFLWLLVALPLVLLLPRPTRDPIHALLRSILLAALALALARPYLVEPDGAEHHVVIFDGTESSAEGRDVAANIPSLLKQLEARGPVALVELGSLLEGNARGEERQPIDETHLSTRVGGPSRSSLSDALFAAAEKIPRGARGSVTLISDGLATDAEQARPLEALCERGIPVHTVKLRGAAGDLVPVSITLDQPLRVGRTARVRVDLFGQSSDVGVRLSSDNEELAHGSLACDGEGSVTLEFEPTEGGFLTLDVSVEARDERDTRLDDNQLRRLFPVQDPWRVLYLGGQTRDARVELQNLLQAGFDFEEREAMSEEGVGPLANFDLVMIDDRPATQLPESFQQTLIQEVIDRGIGLVVTGGTGSFGPGGYQESPIATLLPNEFIQKEEKRDPSTSLVIIIDTSGSMGGERVQLAKEVSRLAISRLLPHDKVGIVEFYGSKRWAAPLQPASNAIDIQRALNRLDAGGGTVILPAIEEAFYGLQNVQTRFKHVLILTDGGVETGAFEPLLRKMADKGMNVSTVLIGPDAHSEFLVTLANWGKGRFYSVPNRFNLPEILLKQPASARLPAYRPGSHPVRGRGGAGWWGEVDRSSLLPLNGYVESRARPGAEVVIETVEGSHPIVASWQYGLGRVTTMTTEPTGQGTSSWQRFPPYGEFLGRLLHRTAGDTRDPFRFSLDRRGDRLFVRADRRSDDPTLRPRASFVGEGETPNLDSSFDPAFSGDIPFRERAPGRFIAELDFPGDRDARLIAGVATIDGRTLESSRTTRLASSAHEEIAAERGVVPRLALDLDAISSATGGEPFTVAQLPDLEPRAGGGGTPLRLRELWPYLLLLALVTVAADLAWRRRPASTRGIAS